MQQLRTMTWDELIRLDRFQLADSPCHYRIGKAPTDLFRFALYKIKRDTGKPEYSADVERTEYCIRLRMVHDGITYYKEIDYREITIKNEK